MSEDAVIDVRGVSKRFCRNLRRSLRYGVQDLARELVTGRRPGDVLRPGEFWAVRDASLQLRRGEALGLIGRNGAGKTTLLRMVAGLIRPDSGAVTTRGRVVPLLALGAGFNPVLSGRENILVNMSILGLSPRQIRGRSDEVIAFAEIDAAAIDAPVRTYSSGMQSRLGFACAAHTDPDVLLIDEVLAVGDMAFRAKCYRRLNHLLKNGTAFVLVSHSAHSVVSICHRGVYLKDGRPVAVGPIDEVMRRYEDVLAASGDASPDAAERRPGRSPTGFDIVSVSFRGEEGEPVHRPASGRPAALCLRCHSDRPRSGVYAAVMVSEYPSAGELSLNMSAYSDGASAEVPAGWFELQVRFPALGLRAGEFVAKVSAAEGWGMNVLDALDSHRFAVVSGEPLGGSTFYQPREWRVATAAQEPVPS